MLRRERREERGDARNVPAAGAEPAPPAAAVPSTPAFATALGYLRNIAREQYEQASDLLDDALRREGLGEMNGAMADVARSLLDRIEFSSGTIDVQAAVDALAQRVVEVAGSPRAGERERQRSLIVFLGSEGLPCAARTDVASWPPVDRLGALVTLAVGLAGAVAAMERRPLDELIGSVHPPAKPKAALGTFSLAWRGADGGPAPLDGAVPRGYTAHITFLGSGTCSLRGIFARVAYLARPRPESTTPRQLAGVADHKILAGAGANAPATPPGTTADPVADSHAAHGVAPNGHAHAAAG